MFEQIQELIVMYAPTVFMAISVITNYLQTFKALKQNVSLMTENITIKNLQKELTETRDAITALRKENYKCQELNKELINEISKVQKYENISTDKKI